MILGVKEGLFVTIEMNPEYNGTGGARGYWMPRSVPTMVLAEFRATEWDDEAAEVPGGLYRDGGWSNPILVGDTVEPGAEIVVRADPRKHAVVEVLFRLPEIHWRAPSPEHTLWATISHRFDGKIEVGLPHPCERCGLRADDPVHDPTSMLLFLAGR